MNIDFGLELAPVCRGDLEQLRTWRNDHRVWRYCRQSDLISDVEQDAWFQRQSADPTIKMYVLVRRVDGNRQAVGVCGLTSIDMISRRAELSMYIGPEHHGKGYGREAFRLLFIHGFQNLGLHQIWIETIGRHPADKLFGELGFRPDGVRRDFYFKDGKHVDAHLYSILRPEWISSLSAPSLSASDPSLPTPPASEPGSPNDAAATVLDIKPTPRRRGKARPKASASPATSQTSEPGSSSRRNEDETALGDDTSELRAHHQDVSYPFPPATFPFDRTEQQYRRGATIGPVLGVGAWELEGSTPERPADGGG